MDMQKNSKKVVPVIFATDDKFAPYCGVAITSLIQCSNKDYFYKLHILFTNLNFHHKKRLKELEQANVSIEFVDVNKQMESRNILNVSHLTAESAYRLLVDELFPMYDKVLYLDCDMVVCKDIAELYEENMDGYIVGAVRERKNAWLVNYLKSLAVPIETYFNAGTLLINVPLFHEQNIGPVSLEMLERGNGRYQCMDQDVLNITCSGKVKYIDGRWNAEWGNYADDNLANDPLLEVDIDSLSDAYIFHYTVVKPWKHPEKKFAEYFWNVARKTVFYEEILQASMQIERENVFSRILFPWTEVQQGTDIILYGAGEVGKTFLHQLQATRYCNVLAVCDKRYQEITDIKLPVVSISDLRMFSFEKLVIAVENEQVANEIRAELLRTGIGAGQIVWKDYRRDPS